MSLAPKLSITTISPNPVPNCCGQPASYYRIEYGNPLWKNGFSWEEGFQCKICGRTRIPYIINWDNSYMDAMEAIREEGMKFDLPQENPLFNEVCRFLSKICIQIINAELKDPIQREWYFLLPSDLGEFAQTAMENKYPWSYVKEIVVRHINQNLKFNPPTTFAELQKLYPCEVLTNADILHEICDRTLAANPKSVSDYKKGKTASLNHLKGLIMRETKGKADIQKVEAILKEKMI